MPGFSWLRHVLLRDRLSVRDQFGICVKVLIVPLAAAAVLTMTLILLSGLQWAVLLFGSLDLIAVLLGGYLGAFTVSHLHSEVVLPLDELSASARQVGGGDLQAVPSSHGLNELRQVAATIATLATALLTERNTRLADRRTGEAEASTLREVLRMTREVGSHLEQEPIIEQLGDAARRIGGYAEVIVWRFDDLAGQLAPSFPKERMTGQFPLRKLNVTDSQVGRAATSGQTVRLREERGVAGGLAVPLTVGGVDLRILGVLELRGEGSTPAMMQNPLDALEALASHAATALAAAQLHEQLEARSETDALTKILNRRKLDSDLKAEVSRSLRYGHALTLIMVDVDHFKAVNDTFGHQTGDEVLKCVAAALARGRETDSAYRFGGEEFAVLLRETDAISGRGVAERLRIRIKEAAATLKLPRDITASLGVSAITSVGQIQSAERLIEAADQALYEAKETGRNKVVVNAVNRGGMQPDAPAGG